MSSSLRCWKLWVSQTHVALQIRGQGHCALTTSEWQWDQRARQLPSTPTDTGNFNPVVFFFFYLFVCLSLYWLPSESTLTPDKNKHETFCFLLVTPTHHTHRHICSLPWQASWISYQLEKKKEPCFSARFSNCVIAQNHVQFWRLNSRLKASALGRSSLCTQQLFYFL